LPPRLIATIGLHGSASTWVFNVVRELLVAALGEQQVLAVYADKMEDVPDPAGLPPGRVVSAGRIVMDPVTQIHRSHIGDARSGKWRDLPDPQQAELTRFFRPFLARWSYPG
jgi:hypothetical protein